MKKEIEIPFDENGNQLSYPDYYVNKWRKNYEFEETLEFVGFYRGRSAAGCTFKDSKGKEYAMFLVDLTRVLKEGFSNGKIKGKFTFQKRGQNFGVRLVD